MQPATIGDLKRKGGADEKSNDRQSNRHEGRECAVQWRQDRWRTG